MLGFRLQVLGLAFSCFFGGIPAASAQTECDAVLKPVLAATSIKSFTHDQASFSFACSHDFQEFNDTYGGSASGQYFAIGGSAAYNQGNYKKFQHDQCNEASASEHQSNFQYNTLRDASSGAVTAWQACMANLAGFNCWAEPENKDIAIVLSLKEPGVFRIQDATLSEDAVLRTPKNRIASNSVLKFGTTRVVVSRPNTDTPISLTVNIAGDVKQYSCRAVVPAALQIPPPSAPPKTFHWKLIRTDDCAAHDIDCTDGADPVDSACNAARLNLVSVCFQHGANPAKPPFPACQGKSDWCTYKSLSLNACAGGVHPGNMWTCVFE